MSACNRGTTGFGHPLASWCACQLFRIHFCSAARQPGGSELRSMPQLLACLCHIIGLSGTACDKKGEALWCLSMTLWHWSCRSFPVLHSVRRAAASNSPALKGLTVLLTSEAIGVALCGFGASKLTRIEWCTFKAT